MQNNVYVKKSDVINIIEELDKTSPKIYRNDTDKKIINMPALKEKIEALPVRKIPKESEQKKDD